MNSLLHLPRGLFYGGQAREGVLDDDGYEPKRWFASHTDAEVLDAASSVFDVLDFHVVDLGTSDLHFQSLTLRAR